MFALKNGGLNNSNSDNSDFRFSKQISHFWLACYVFNEKAA